MSEEISMTEAAEGEFHLTPSAQAILAYLEECGGEPVTKSVIAADLGRSEKTVDRLMSKMREPGYIQAEEHWTETGAQLANSYTVVSR